MEFLDFLQKRLNKKLEVSFSDWRPGDQKVYISDISKAKRKLGWIPSVGFNEGFEAMLEWIEANKSLLGSAV